MDARHGRVSQVDEVTHWFEMSTMMGGRGGGALVQVRALGFHFGEEWAFNMQLSFCPSVRPRLMSCCFPSPSGGWAIIRHARQVPRPKTTGYLMVSIIRENGPASAVAADLTSPSPSSRS